jgi:hypothetical protein
LDVLEYEKLSLKLFSRGQYTWKYLLKSR